MFGERCTLCGIYIIVSHNAEKESVVKRVYAFVLLLLTKME